MNETDVIMARVQAEGDREFIEASIRIVEKYKMNNQVTDQKVTPSALEVLLHYHFSAKPHPRHDAPAVVEARQAFLKRGVLKPIWVSGSMVVDIKDERLVGKKHRYFATTERGKAWVNKLCETPCPE